ncbi:MAG: MBOAT family protein [Anaerolineales bacterium]|nr:MBOAT family protein [Anaerolineales bacterium]
MFLHTPQYLLFLAVTVILYWMIPGGKARKVLLLLASYFFYVQFDFRFALLLFVLTGCVFFIGRTISISTHAKQWMWGGVILNLAILSIFKFSNFFLASMEKLGSGIDGTVFLSGLLLILPIGISFYSFQGISYVVEIYRGKLQPNESFLDFALYMAFFPKLIAGPFVRPSLFMTELAKPQQLPQRNIIRQAILLLVLGLFKKIVIADSLGALSQTAFKAANYTSATLFPSPLYLQGFYLYAIQIYADFSGYTDLARASAMLFGFFLPENFYHPYLAGTISEFWNRWHITLTQWFRDYLFNPLTRVLLKKTNRRYPIAIQILVNLITMLLIGLWHGASWPFLIWGGWHGLLLSVERLFNIKPKKWWQLLYGILTFHLIGIGWIFFNAGSVSSAIRFLVGVISFSQMGWTARFIWPVLLAGVLSFGLDLVMLGKLFSNSRFLRNFQSVFIPLAVVIVVSLWLLSAARGGDTRPFIYGQF